MTERLNINSTNTYIIVLSLATLYVIAGKISFNLLSGNGIVNIGLFASEGFALAFALQFGKKAFFGVFLGQFVLALINNINIEASFAIATINATEALLGIYLFKKFKLKKDLNQFRDIVGLLLLIAFILQIYSAVFSNTILLLNGYITSQEFLYSSFSWWFGNIMGQFLFTPFLLILFKEYKQIDYLNLFFHSFVFLTYLYIFEILLNLRSPLLLLSLTIPIIIYITSKKGTFYGMFFSIITSLGSSFSIYLQKGAFYTHNNLEDTINYNLFVLANILVALTTSALFHEKKQNEINLQRMIDEEVEKNKHNQLLMIQQSRLAQMGEMIAMIAHQWRQPLNNLSLVNQLLVSKYEKAKLDDKTIKYFSENSKKQIREMSRTIDDFRNFFKAEKFEQDFSINEVVRNILNMVETIYTNNNIKINFHSKKDYHSVGYPNELGQAILNIINNAKDALIEQDIDEKYIDIFFEETDEYIVINIIDNAGGIPDDIIDKIFDPYFSTKTEKNGTGLGLYITRIILQEHMNAKITVQNNDNGATFKIYLKRKI